MNKRERLQDISDRIELMESMLEAREVPESSIKIIENDISELYTKAMNLALS